MSQIGRRRRVVLVAVLVLLALFVFRPGVNRFRKRIVNSISLALGRTVDVQWVKLRVLPQPGFDLVNFVVHDDPAFGAEPILRAQNVTAVLRLRSLLRGRIEVGRLSLQEPSFNLVRGDNGHWNIESLIDRAAHSQVAPTRNTRPERRPVFPYIEADNGRINFKVGVEKKSYSLTDADFALWLESDNLWGMRLSAQPVRTDFNLTDTGMIRVNGTWQRSDSLRSMPLKFSLSWDGAQLGELTKLLYGRDMGWRGGLTLSAELLGTPADLRVSAKSSISDFRRYDIVPQQSLRLATTCEASYSSIEHAVSDLLCQSPIGEGSFSVKGRIGAPTGPRTYDLNFALQRVPIQAVVNLARRSKKDLPEDLSATGTVEGNFSLQTSTRDSLAWSGGGHTELFVLRSTSTDSELTLGTLPFRLQSLRGSGEKHSDSPPPELANVRLDIGPLTLVLGKQSSAVMQGQASAEGYNVAIQGEGAIQRLLQTAQMAGLQVPQISADGTAKFDLLLAGKWSGFAVPRPTGTAQLRSVSARLPGLNGAVNIRSANLALDYDTVQASDIVAAAAGTSWEGSLSFPRPCHLLDGCPIHFDLQADLVDSNRFHQWLSPSRKRPWYRFGGSGTQPPYLLSVLNAGGKLAANRVNIHGVAATRVECGVQVRDGIVQVTGLRADLFGGRHRGDWSGDLRVSPPVFTGTGKFEHVALGKLAEAMRDRWISGTAKGNYQLSAEGTTVRDWLASARGALQFDMRDGSLPHIIIASGAGPLPVRRFTGQLALSNGQFEIAHGKLESGNVAYEVAGTTVAGQKLQMKLARAGGGFRVDGTLSAPHVVPVNATDARASLKP